MMERLPTEPISRRVTRRGISQSLAALALISIVSISPRAALADEAEDAQVFLKSLTDKAITRLTNESIPAQEREDNFRALFRENFDIDAIGRFVVGRYWRSADQQARDDFLATFENVMVQRFAPQFAGYGDTRFEIKGVRAMNAEGQYLVSSSIALPGKEPAQVDWRVRHDGGRWNVLDVIGEGVSMAQTLRSEYGSVLKDVGGDLTALTAKLRSALPAGSRQSASN
jgi:phospholipid transport system substrate-binding protein